MKEQRNINTVYKLIQFNGVDTFLSIDQQINFAPTKGFIIDFWMKPELKQSNSTVFYCNTIYGNFPITIGFISNLFQANVNGSSFPLQLDSFFTSWNHFAFFYDPVRSIAGWYINGMPNIFSQLSLNNFSAQTITIGCANGDSFFKGNLALFRLWSAYDSPREISKLCHSYYTEKCEDLFLQLELVNGMDSNAAVNSGNWFTPQFDGAPNFNLKGTSKWVDCVIPFSGMITEKVLQIPEGAMYNFMVQSGFTKDTTDFTIEFWFCPLQYGNRSLLQLNQMKSFPQMTIEIIKEGGFGLVYTVKGSSVKSKVVIWDYDWHHISLKFNSKTNTLETYRDNELFDSHNLLTFDNSNFGPSNYSNIFSMFYGGGISLQFSELRFWNKYLSKEDELRLSNCRVALNEPGLCGYFPFSDNAINWSNNYLGIGTIINNSKQGSLVEPKNGQFSTAFLKNCFNFNGTSSQLNFYSYAFASYNAFSIDLWVSRSRFDVSEVVFDSSIIKVAFAATNEMVVWVNNTNIQFAFPMPYKNSNWYNWAFTLNKDSGNLGCYFNGDLIFSAKINGIAQLNGFALGSEINGGQKFQGAIGNLSIWNKELLQDEVISNSHKRLTGLEPGLLHYYTFDNFDNQLVVDECKRASLTGLTSGLVGPGNVVVPNFIGQVPKMKFAAKKAINNKYLEEIKIAKDNLNKAVLLHEVKIKTIFYNVEQKLTTAIPELLTLGYNDSLLRVVNRNIDFKSSIQLPEFAKKGSPFIDPIAGKIVSIEPRDKIVTAKFPTKSAFYVPEFSKKLLIDNTSFEIAFFVRFDDPNAANYLGSFGPEADSQGFQVNYQADGRLYFGTPGNNAISMPFDKHNRWQYIRIQYNHQNRGITFLQDAGIRGTYYIQKPLVTTSIFPANVSIGYNLNRNNLLTGQMGGVYIFKENTDIRVLQRVTLGFGNFPEIKLVAYWKLYIKQGENAFFVLLDSNNYFFTYYIDSGGFEEGPIKLPPPYSYAIEFRGYNSYLNLNKIQVSDNCNIGMSFMMKYQKLKRRACVFNSLNDSGSSECSIQVNEKDDVEFIYLGQVFTISSEKYNKSWNEWHITLNNSTRQLKIFINQLLVLETGVSNILELNRNNAYLGCDKPNGYAGFIGLISGFKIYTKNIFNIPMNNQWFNAINGRFGSDVVIFDLPFRDTIDIGYNRDLINYAYDVQKGSLCQLVNCTWRFDVNVGQSVVVVQSDFKNNITRTLLPFSTGIQTANYTNEQSVVGLNIANLKGKFGFVGGIIFDFDIMGEFYSLIYQGQVGYNLTIDSANDRIRINNNQFVFYKQRTITGINDNWGISFEPKLIPELNQTEELILDYSPSFNSCLVAQNRSLYFFQGYSKISKIELNEKIMGIATLPQGSVFLVYLQNGEIYAYDINTRILSFEAKGEPTNTKLRQFFAIDNNRRVDEKIKLGLLQKKEQLLALNRKLALTKAKYLTQLEQSIIERQKVDDRINAYLDGENQKAVNARDFERRKIQMEIKAYQDKIAEKAAEQRRIKKELEDELNNSIDKINNSYDAIVAKAGRMQGITEYLLTSFPYESVVLTKEEAKIIRNE